MHATPSPSSLVKPLELHKPVPLLKEQQALLEVLADSQQRETLSALEMVWVKERAHHLHEAAFSEDAERRAQHRGVVVWLDEVLSGVMMARHEQEARAKLDVHPPIGLPEAGTPWMESDGLNEEIQP